MDFGAAIFFTDYSMGPAELGRALEERGFGSLWAPEHSHIPLSRRSPFPQGGELPKKYYDVMDPFVTLAAAAAATTRLQVATGVCLVVQRDPIQTAKQVASLDQISGGRFLFGIGAGWNAEEMADHGTDFKSRFRVMRERVEAMRAIWTKSKPEYDGEFVKFRPMMTWPKPAQKPHPPVIVGGAFPYGARLRSPAAPAMLRPCRHPVPCRRGAIRIWYRPFSRRGLRSERGEAYVTVRLASRIPRAPVGVRGRQFPCDAGRRGAEEGPEHCRQGAGFPRPTHEHSRADPGDQALHVPGAHALRHQGRQGHHRRGGAGPGRELDALARGHGVDVQAQEGRPVPQGLRRADGRGRQVQLRAPDQPAGARGALQR